MIDRAKFMSEILEFATKGLDPETVINNALMFMGQELGADRAYIFEEVRPGYFDNTYEWCCETAVPQIDNLKDIPYEGVVEPWYSEYRKNRNIFIEDLEEYHDVCPPMYDVLKPQDITSLISGPLILDDIYVGFFGVDNPPREKMKEISKIITLLTYAFSLMLRYRNDSIGLEKLAKKDSLTGLSNRLCFEEELNKYSGEPIPDDLVFISFDVNGLKQVNDTLGHVAGDELLRGAAHCIRSVYISYGDVFRRGGDEFSAIIRVDSDTLTLLNQKFESVMAAYKGNLIKEVSISYGYAVAADDSDLSILQLEQLSEERMYRCKADYYVLTGKDRRGQHNPYRTLCNGFERIIIVNLDKDTATIFKMSETDTFYEKTHDDKYSNWILNFVEKEYIDPAYYDIFTNTLSVEELSNRFSNGHDKLSLKFCMNKGSRKGQEELLLVIPSSDYKDDNRVLFFYVIDV